MERPRDEALAELVERAQNGDRQAFSAIVRKLMHPVTALTYRMTRDRDTAVDLAQDTFVAAWEKLGSFRGEAKFESWLFSIASNKTLNYLKAKANQPAEDVAERTDLTSPDDPEAALARAELREQVLAFMQSLPEQQRLVFNLRFYRQMSFDEIATTTGRALGTVKTNYRMAVQKLREHAVEMGWRS